MNAHASAHEAARKSLPWLANGSLAGAELDSVQAHLRDCPQCRDELAMLSALREAGPGPAPDCDPDRAFARLLPRLDVPSNQPEAAAPSPAPLERWRARIAANDSYWLRRAVLLQCGLIAVLLALLARPVFDDRKDYRLLGAGTAAPARIVVMFQPDTPERELRRIVRASGARIVDGPTVTDAYLVGIDGDADAVLAKLRAEPAVQLAEPLGAEKRP